MQKLGEIASIKGGKRLPKGESLTTNPNSHPYIRTRDIENHVIRIDQLEYVPDAVQKKIARYTVDAGDLLVSIVGTVGSCAIVPEELHLANLTENCAKILLNTKDYTTDFLYYFLRSPQGQHEILKNTVGSTQLKLPLYGIENIDLPTVTFTDQKAIGHILGTLDKKIELNRKTNQTLEDIAKAIFKSWFVDFDPVRAKTEGRPTGLPPEIDELFPDELVDSEIGEIPKGWVTCAVGSFVKLNEQSWSKKNHPEFLDYLDLGNIKSNKIYETETYFWDEAPSRARRVLKIGDTIVGTVRPGNRSYGFVQRSGITGSTGFAVLTPLQVEYAEFIYLGVCSDTNIDRLAHLADGAAYPAVSNEIVLETSFVKPSSDLVMRFHELVNPLMHRLEIADQENAVLSEIRDTLLPKLISGELRIPDAEKFLEEAGV